MKADIVIRNALLRGERGGHFDIAIAGGEILAIEPSIKGDAAETIDAGGNLVTESFVNGHLHLCKVYTLEMAGMDALSSHTRGSMGGAMTAIEQAARIKAKYDERWIIQNVRKALDLAVRFGNTHIRAFADTDTKARSRGSQGSPEGPRRVQGPGGAPGRGFPSGRGGAGSGAEDYVRQALELGADVVGGIPWIEYTDEDARQHIDRMFALAKGTARTCPCWSTTPATPASGPSRCSP